MRKHPVLATALAVVATACGCLSATPALAQARTLTIAVTNDFHGRLNEQTVTWAGTVEQIRAETPDSLFLSAGDNIGASAFASSVQGETPTIEMFNALQLDASAVGNNEFFIGYADFMTRIRSGAHFPYLGANVVDAATRAPVLDPYIVASVNGIRVAVIGAITPETQVQFSGDPEFLDVVDTLNDYAEGIAARNEADVIVAVIHDGGGLNAPATLADEEADGGMLWRLVTQTSPLVDVLITGHTHNQYVYDAPMPGDATRTRPVIQTGSFGQKVGAISLTLESSTLKVTSASARLVGLTSTPQTDLIAQFPRVAAVAGVVEAALDYADAHSGPTYGFVSADITTAYRGGEYTDAGYRGGANGDRTQESSIGTLVANVIRDAQQGATNPPLFGIGLPNFVRDDILHGRTGAVTDAILSPIFAIPDLISSADVTGAQLKQLLEEQWQRTATGENKGYIQLVLSDNLTYTFDTTRPEGDRITSIWISGQRVDTTPPPADSDDPYAPPARTYRGGFSGNLLFGLVNFHTAPSLANVESGELVKDGVIAHLGALGSSGAAPDFRRHGVEVRGLPLQALASDIPAYAVSFDVSGLDLTSLGAPENTRMAVAVIGNGQTIEHDLGEVAVTGGGAHVSVNLPTDLPTGPAVIRLQALPSGTVASLPLEITGVRKAANENPRKGSGGGGTLSPLALLALAAGVLLAAGRRRDSMA